MWVLVVATLLSNQTIENTQYFQTLNETDCKRNLLVIEAINNTYLENEQKKLVAACMRMS